ncbi:MAG TPA: hypothetical protein VMT62_02610 [Syntrophorhabdaceae bacterium]|nr:hypothetical protein [Syntrophorhabdaceae bacterium]
MRMLWFWFVFGVFFTLAVIMIVFGIHFISDIYYYGEGENIFGSLIIGIILLLAGGGILSSTVAETVRKFLKK